MERLENCNELKRIMEKEVNKFLKNTNIDIKNDDNSTIIKKLESNLETNKKKLSETLSINEELIQQTIKNLEETKLNENKELDIVKYFNEYFNEFLTNKNPTKLIALYGYYINKLKNMSNKSLKGGADINDVGTAIGLATLFGSLFGAIINATIGGSFGSLFVITAIIGGIMILFFETKHKYENKHKNSSAEPINDENSPIATRITDGEYSPDATTTPGVPFVNIPPTDRTSTDRTSTDRTSTADPVIYNTTTSYDPEYTYVDARPVKRPIFTTGRGGNINSNKGFGQKLESLLVNIKELSNDKCEKIKEKIKKFIEESNIKKNLEEFQKNLQKEEEKSPFSVLDKEFNFKKEFNFNKGGRRMRKLKGKSLKKRGGRKSIKKGVKKVVKKVVKKGGRKSVRKSLNKRGRKSVRR